MNSFNQTLSNLSIKILILGISLIVSLFIPAILGPQLFGLYTLILVWVGFLIPITSLGFGSGIVYSISNKSYSFQSVLNSNVVIACSIGFINVVILIIFKVTGILNHFDSNLQGSGFMVLLLSIFLQSIHFIIGRAFLGNSEYRKLNTLDLLNSLLNPVILLVAIYVVDRKGTSFIYYSYGILSVILVAVDFFLLKGRMNWNGLNKMYVLGAYKYGVKSWIGDIALRANLRVDQLILGSFISLNALGIYSVAVKLVELIWLIPDSVGPVLFNAISGIKNKEEKLILVSKVHRLVFASCTIFLIVWLIACYVFIIPNLLGSAYKDVFNLILLLAPGILLLTSSKIITKLFSASGEVQWTSQITIFGGIMSILFYMILIPSYGTIGGAIASTLGYISLVLAGIFVLKSNYEFSFREYYFIQNADFTWMKNRLRNILKSYLSK